MNTVHPHVHGELSTTFRQGCCHTGSSPRAWGTRFRLLFGLIPRRFIPTCMGNSKKPSNQKLATPVHPHVHGELSRIFIWNMEDYFLDTLMEGVSDR